MRKSGGGEGKSYMRSGVREEVQCLELKEVDFMVNLYEKMLLFLIILSQNASTPSSDLSFLTSLGRGGIVSI